MGGGGIDQERKAEREHSRDMNEWLRRKLDKFRVGGRQEEPGYQHGL